MTAVEGNDDLPSEFRLGQSYPNPFNPATVISYELPERAVVQLTVHDALGRLVRVLVDQDVAAGRYTATFDASGFPSGLYLYRMRAGQFESSGKMMLMK